jgi:hypothetical protein
MTAEGPRKGEPSTRIVRNGLRTQPANSVRGSSRRIMAMRFRPANISVINRRASSWAVIGPAVQNPGSKPTSGNMFPLRRPSKAYRVPERCSPSRVRFAAPKTGAPLTAAGRSAGGTNTTGGSGGKTTTAYCVRRRNDLPAIHRPVLAVKGTATGRFLSSWATSSVSRSAGLPKLNLRRRRYAVPANGCLVTLRRWPNP